MVSLSCGEARAKTSSGLRSSASHASCVKPPSVLVRFVFGGARSEPPSPLLHHSRLPPPPPAIQRQKSTTKPTDRQSTTAAPTWSSRTPSSGLLPSAASAPSMCMTDPPRAISSRVAKSWMMFTCICVGGRVAQPPSHAARSTLHVSCARGPPVPSAPLVQEASPTHVYRIYPQRERQRETERDRERGMACLSACVCVTLRAIASAVKGWSPVTIATRT